MLPRQRKQKAPRTPGKPAFEAQGRRVTGRLNPVVSSPTHPYQPGYFEPARFRNAAITQALQQNRPDSGTFRMQHWMLPLFQRYIFRLLTDLPNVAVVGALHLAY